MRKVLPLLLLMLTGCASLPPCERYQAQGVYHDGELYAVFDRSNLEKLARTLKGLHEGTYKFTP